jgi:hypothetical protein
MIHGSVAYFCKSSFTEEQKIRRKKGKGRKMGKEEKEENEKERKKQEEERGVGPTCSQTSLKVMLLFSQILK